MRERIIGAIAVVVVAIVVIPWIVSRSHAPREIVHTLAAPAGASAPAGSDATLYDLPPLTTAGQPARESTRAAPAARVQPQRHAPAAATPAAPAAKPPAAAKPQPTQPASGDWNVQAASFTDRKSARDVIARLAAQGLHAHVSPHDISGKTYYRVIVGPYPSEKAAHAALARISAVTRTPGIVLAPGSD